MSAVTIVARWSTPAALKFAKQSLLRTFARSEVVLKGLAE